MSLSLSFEFLADLSMGRAARVRVQKTYVWPVLFFGCGAWTISKEIRRRFEATKMCFYRKMMRNRLTARRTNQ